MSSGRRFLRIRASAAIRAVAAAALLFAIAVDIVADTRCHPLSPGDAPAAYSAARDPATDQDLCGVTCVPDCFCCSTLSVTAPGVALESTAAAGRVAGARERACPSGVHPAPYRPPIVLA